MTDTSIEWTRTRLERIYETPHYILVHAGRDPRRTLTGQRAADLLWSRADGDFAEFSPRPVVHGHTRVGTVQRAGNRVNISGGAGFGGPEKLQRLKRELEELRRAYPDEQPERDDHLRWRIFRTLRAILSSARMRFLVTADIHGLVPAITRFAEMLREGEYECGIIAGDIIDDGFKPEEMQEAIAESDLEPDDFLAELPGADESFEEYAERQIETLHDPAKPFMRTLGHMETKFKRILRSAGKPVYLIPGNHDLTSWEDDGDIRNIHDRRVDLGPLNLVGYRWTSLDRSSRDHRRDIRRLSRLVDSHTLLVTHTPPRGVLDGGPSDDGTVIGWGTEPVARMVSRKKPFLHVFGHVHRTFGRLDRSINASFPWSRRFVDIDTNGPQVVFLESGVHDRLG